MSDNNVFLNINRPNANTDIKVCAKFRIGNEDYDAVEWYELKPKTPIPINSDINSYSEVEFDFDPEALLSANGSDFMQTEFNAFAVRIVFSSTDPRNIPTVKDFRAIATFG